MNNSPLYPLDASANEAILAPLHDPQIRPSLTFSGKAVSAKGLEVQETWANVLLQWDSCPADQEATRFEFLCQVQPGRYDRVILCLAQPDTVSVRCSLQLDGKWGRPSQAARGTGTRMEIELPLPRGKTLTGIRCQFHAHADTSASVSINWFGLAESRAVQRQLEAKVDWDTRWPGLIKEDIDWKHPRFTRGLFFAETDLPGLRRKAGRTYWKDNFAVLEAKALKYMGRIPEDDIGEYVPWSDVRYSRQREQGKEPLYLESLVLGFVGLVRNDEAMMRHAIRYLLSTVHTTHWCQSAESRVKGSSWDQRCFIEELSSTSVAILFDWFGFALTPRAHDLIRHALWDKGLAVIERDMMKCEYIYHMNQGPWFCRARVLGGLMLEGAWPRVGGYVDRAFADQAKGMRNYILQDGGTDEGIGYFSLTMNAVLWTVMGYARARKKDPAKLLPPQFKEAENFTAIMSGVRPGTTLMDGDQSTDYFVGDTLPILAGLFPESPYADIAAAALAQDRPFTYFNHYLVDGLLSMVWGPDRLKKPASIVPTFGRLPKTGHLTSCRDRTRIHLSGCKARPSHSHFDKGAFTLEIDGEPTLIDRGVVRYDDARGPLMKRSCLHNIITPVEEDGGFADQDPPAEPVIPTGRGDARQLDARIRLDHVWRNHMSACSRRIRSDDPNTFEVIDQGERLREGRIAFHLQARQSFEAGATSATLAGKLKIHAPWAERIYQYEDGIDYRFEPIYHLVILSQPLQAFDLKTTFELI